MSRRVLSGVVVALLLLTTASGQQQTRQPISQPQTPTFKSQDEYVQVDVRVTNSTGKFVQDLTKVAAERDPRGGAPRAVHGDRDRADALDVELAVGSHK